MRDKSLVKKYIRNKLSRVGAAAAYAESAAAYAGAAAAYADAAAAYADAAAAYARTVKIKPNSLELSLQAVRVLAISITYGQKQGVMKGKYFHHVSQEFLFLPNINLVRGRKLDENKR